MWRTQYGNRILEPKEAALFAESLLSLLDEFFIDQYEEYPLGIRAFDNLTCGQKISTLSTIANGLLRDDVPIVPLTAVLEAAIAAVYEHLKNLIIIEIDEPDLGTNRREMVVAARKEAEGEEIPAPNCEDIEEWDIELQYLSEAILWDADYDDEDQPTDSE